MLDANAEIARLRQRLQLRNLSSDVIDSICDQAASEISMLTADLLADAMTMAVELGKDSDDFISEIKAVRSSGSFSIGTESGRTDFSEAPFPMLPKLLKNAKVAKDGSLYKVIPMKNKTDNKSISNTVESAMVSIENARHLARNKANDDTVRSSNQSPDAMKGMGTIAAMQNIAKISKNRENSNKRQAVTSFRTASSKQDASTMWVNPGKEADMSGIIRNINDNLHDSIDIVISDVISKYDGMY